MIRLNPALISLFVLVSVACHAEERDPNASPTPQAFAPSMASPPGTSDDILKDVQPTVKKRLSLDFALGSFKGLFEQTSLSAITKSTGTGSIQEIGDTGAHTYSLCYSLNTNHPSQRLWITSDGEMGGPQHKITGMVLKAVVPSREKSPLCPSLPKAFAAPVIDRNIKLGISPKKLVEALGKPSKVAGDELIYFHAGKVAKGFDETSVIIVRLTGDQITYISASKVTSN